MSANVKKLKEDVAAIQKGLMRIGRNRLAALPVHTSLELIDSMEEAIARIATEVEKIGKSDDS